MNAITLLKGGISLVSGFGATKIIGLAVEKVVPEALNNAEKVVITIGTFALGGAAGLAASEYVEGLIDTVLDIGQGMVDTVKERKMNKANA